MSLADLDDNVRATLRKLPPSAKLTYRALVEIGPSTQRRLAEETLLPPRTVRYALDRLTDAGLVSERPSPRDARQSIYER